MLQLTLIALYGDKAPELSSFIVSCQCLASSALGGAFRPYDVRQVHATLIGLEGSEGSPLHNANFGRLRGQRVRMDIPGFLESLRASSALPFGVQIGGFAEQDSPFLSRGEPPFRRAFSIQGEKAVVVGWPRGTDYDAGAGDYAPTLDTIRRRAQEFGILHAYHGSETDLDNDFFFRIGFVDRGAVSDDAVKGLEQRVRRHMGRLSPSILKIGLGDLQVVAYGDDRLPLSSTEVWPVADPGLDGAILAALSRCCEQGVVP